MAPCQNSAMQERIKFLKDLQRKNPETASWFDESLEFLLNEEGGERFAEATKRLAETA